LTVKDACEEFLLYIKSVRGMSLNTVSSYKNDLIMFISMKHIGSKRDIKTVTTEDLRLCIGQLSLQKKEASTINRFIACVRSLFSYCRKFSYLETNPAAELKTIKMPKRLPNFLTGNEVDKLCREPEENPLLWEKRDRALFELMYSSGCRLSEVAGLKLSDFSNGFSSAVVTGKGSKDRIVYLEADSKKAVEDYLAERNSRFPERKVTNPKDFLFVNQKGSPLSARGISFILSKYSGPEGTNHHVNPHALRHTFATAMISGGADVRLVQEMLGHSSISTTQRYTHVSTEQMIAMYNKAHPHGGNN
jgi:integrase/recombinase XerC